jgi:hypothetical protein
MEWRRKGIFLLRSVFCRRDLVSLQPSASHLSLPLRFISFPCPRKTNSPSHSPVVNRQAFSLPDVLKNKLIVQTETKSKSQTLRAGEYRAFVK